MEEMSTVLSRQALDIDGVRNSDFWILTLFELKREDFPSKYTASSQSLEWIRLVGVSAFPSLQGLDSDDVFN